MTESKRRVNTVKLSKLLHSGVNINDALIDISEERSAYIIRFCLTFQECRILEVALLRDSIMDAVVNMSKRFQISRK